MNLRCRPGLLAAAALLPLVLLAAGCSDDEPFEGSQPPSATATAGVPASPTPEASTGGTTGAEPSATAATVPPEPTIPPAPASGFAEVSVERVFADAQFENPTGLYQDAEGSWYLTEQPGRVQRIQAGSENASVWLDITDRVDDTGNEMGLLGFALAPDFEASHTFYVNYTGGGETVISRFTASDDHTSVDRGSEQVLLTVVQPYRNHNGGQIAFGPDGYLYIAFGDGGSGNDPEGHGQNLGTLLGAILRIDVAGDQYAVPDDNPFVGQSDAMDEIWAYGLRNPWRFSFDRETGDLWAGDVGQSAREEIDLIVRGGNYGWNVTEGFNCRGGGSNCNDEGMLPPVFDYSTGGGGTCSVTGGFVYRGSAIPALRGAYVFSDYCSGVIYALRAQDGVLTEQAELAETGLNVSSLAQDNEGELYVLDLGGGVYRIIP